MTSTDEIATIKNALDNDNAAHDLSAALRMILIELASNDECDLQYLTTLTDLEIPDIKTTTALIALAHALRDLYEKRDDMTRREFLTELALQQSLCPMHFIDYAICFDNDDEQCAAIRMIHPAYDS